jgi:hypothetical protein
LYYIALNFNPTFKAVGFFYSIVFIAVLRYF